MLKVKRIKSANFYVFSGRSAANSCFIEKLSHAKSLLSYANYFLRGYVKIYDYIITKDGWLFVVKILEREKSEEVETWRIISERIRLFLSTFVRVTNKQKGRTGTLVHRSYERFCFETLGEAKRYLDVIRTQQIKLYNGRKKYRGLKSHYKIGHSIGKGSIFLCSKELRGNARKVGEVFVNRDVSSLVLQKMIKTTLIDHFLPTSPKNPFTPIKM